jgi:tetratricopeptide (TPR) repeat protein
MLGLMGVLRGQAEFDLLYAEAQQSQSAPDADAEQVLRAYGRALRAFLQIPPDANGYGSRLAQGGRAALSAGRPGLALELALELITREGETEAHLALKLQALAEAGDRDGFLAAARAAEDRFPGAIQPALAEDRRRDPRRLLGWADGWLRAGRTEDGLWLFRRFADSAHPFELADLALALRHAGREDECERTYRRALAAAPGDFLLQNDFGLFLRGVGRTREALEVFRQSYALEPSPGEGPAITNLVQMALFHPDLLDPPLEPAARALALRPESEMLRRVTLDLLLRESGNPFPGADPDREARGG